MSIDIPEGDLVQCSVGIPYSIKQKLDRIIKKCQISRSRFIKEAIAMAIKKAEREA